MTQATFESAAATDQALREVGYIPNRDTSMAVYLASRLGKPILAEGPAGTGKTELAKAIALATGRTLYRVQCYEGLDEAKLLYEWQYAKQLLYTQMLRDKITELTDGADSLSAAIEAIAAHDDAFFSEHFLEARPLLAAIRSADPTVLLIDEVDRAEEEIEALLLEVLAENQVTVPELGTIVGTATPIVLLTSNDTRELSEALRRRCLYLYLDYPGADREIEILKSRVAGLDDALAAKVAAAVSRARTLEFKKTPSLSEAIDWARALVLLSSEELGSEQVAESLGLLLKVAGDAERARTELADELAQIATN